MSSQNLSALLDVLTASLLLLHHTPVQGLHIGEELDYQLWILEAKLW